MAHGTSHHCSQAKILRTVPRRQCPDLLALDAPWPGARPHPPHAGLFTSKEDALAYGVRRLGEEAKQLEALRADIQVGIDQADRGKFSSRAIEDIKDNIRRHLENEQKNGA